MTVRELRELCELAEAQLGPDAVVMFRPSTGGPWARLDGYMVGAERPPQAARLERVQRERVQREGRP